MKYTIMIAALGLSALGAAAEEARPHDEIEISASAERELPNDTLVASVYAEADGPKQADVAAKVNAAIAWALEQTKQVAGVTARTQQYYTNPVYDDRRITGWRKVAINGCWLCLAGGLGVSGKRQANAASPSSVASTTHGNCAIGMNSSR